MTLDKKALNSGEVLSKKINKATNAIKKKYLSLKIGEKDAEEYSKKKYKPLIDEISKIK